MKWWKRILFAVISLVWGYVSLDYLYLALCLISDRQDSIAIAWIKKEGLMQLIGFILFVLWLIMMVVYTRLLMHHSPQINLIETDEKTGDEKVKHKYFDIIMQYAFVLTGIFCRWAYLLLFYFPNR